MVGAMEVLAKDQVLTSPTSIQWDVLSAIGAMDVVRPFKNLIDTFETISKMTISAKAGRNGDQHVHSEHQEVSGEIYFVMLCYV